MNRAIEIRLKRLEDASAPAPVETPRRSHVIWLDLEPGQDPEAAKAAARAELIASGEGGPDDFIWWLVPLKAGEDEWRHRKKYFRDSGGWSEAWGPRPGEPGCVADTVEPRL